LSYLILDPFSGQVSPQRIFVLLYQKNKVQLIEEKPEKTSPDEAYGRKPFATSSQGKQRRAFQKSLSDLSVQREHTNEKTGKYCYDPIIILN